MPAPGYVPPMTLVWSLPTDAKTGERDSLVMVTNDQRGGTNVVEVTVEYR